MPCVCRCLRRPEEGLESPGTGLTCSCEPPDMGVLGTDLGPLQERCMLIRAEPSLQPLEKSFKGNSIKKMRTEVEAIIYWGRWSFGESGHSERLHLKKEKR